MAGGYEIERLKAKQQVGVFVGMLNLELVMAVLGLPLHLLQWPVVHLKFGLQKRMFQVIVLTVQWVEPIGLSLLTEILVAILFFVAVWPRTPRRSTRPWSAVALYGPWGPTGWLRVVACSGVCCAGLVATLEVENSYLRSARGNRCGRPLRATRRGSSFPTR